MEVRFFSNVGKRNNSTKLPTGPTAIFNCTLKDDCSVLNPVIEVDERNLANPWTYNYAQIQTFGNRFYYVNDWNYYRGVWSASLAVDVLASYRSTIRTSTAYVKYRSSASTLKVDPRLSDYVTSTCTSYETPAELTPFSEIGCYILSVISTDANGDNGACALYALTKAQLGGLSSLLTSQSFLDGVWDSIRNSFNNPFEAIVSCRWIPFEASSLSGTEKTIIIGYADTTVRGKLLNSNFKGLSATMNLPRRSTTQSFLDVEPFTTATLYLPFVGVVPLDLTAYSPSTTFAIDMKCDVATGDIVYTVGRSFTEFTSTYSGNCSTPIVLSNTSPDAVGMTAGAIGIIGGLTSAISAVATKDPTKLGLSLGATAGATIGEIKSAQIHTQTNGAISSRIGAKMGLTYRVVVIQKTMEGLSSTRNTMIGQAEFSVMSLSSITGYCQCENANVNVVATVTEKEMINDYLNTGIYIE